MALWFESIVTGSLVPCGEKQARSGIEMSDYAEQIPDHEKVLEIKLGPFSPGWRGIQSNMYTVILVAMSEPEIWNGSPAHFL